MKDGLIHICFVIDESGSMAYSKDDITGGFKQMIEDQKKSTVGECIVSLYRFSDGVTCDFIGKPVSEIQDIEYHPRGLTAMNDGVGTAIDEIGKWLCDMNEEDRPSKNMIVIMTDGIENNSVEYTLDDVKQRIQHQEEKYSWTFVYMGTDIHTLKDADNLGINIKSLSSRDNIVNNYKHISNYANTYKCCKSTADCELALSALSATLDNDTKQYCEENK